jgi:hypothetical protein
MEMGITKVNPVKFTIQVVLDEFRGDFFNEILVDFSYINPIFDDVNLSPRQ